MAKKDWKVVVENKRLGGVCVISGCTFKKAMEAISKIVHNTNGLVIKQKTEADITGI